ncbi:Golgi-specific brefeldin A-resistance guanine nucleotide exchange factor 1 (BFA-resistant GEF 1) [Durusdinium trenchii]|uniref:Golgi-specific brefeldin A-resistance guanine nucleotide exchange factor 1 (BFA-resistant GEF 1) n=1 Tax=Durusdinium trenchii TaxID=1381693 RepID=A0ABP0HNC4_9DINO
MGHFKGSESDTTLSLPQCVEPRVDPSALRAFLATASVTRAWGLRPGRAVVGAGGRSTADRRAGRQRGGDVAHGARAEGGGVGGCSEAGGLARARAMDGSQCLNCVRSEIHNVLSTMRRNGRWAAEERFVREIPSEYENPLIRALKSLHDFLQPFEDINDVDAVSYLQPFLDVVAFPNTNGAMTGRALSSINKFLLYGAVTQESPRGREAINLAVSSVVECKFEATNSYSDEVVLMQLLEVMVNLLRCPAGPFISDVNVWKMVETSYRLKTETGTGQLLRSTAANSLTHLVLTLFSRSADLITVDAIVDLEERVLNFDGSQDSYFDSVVGQQNRARRQSEDGGLFRDQLDRVSDQDQDEDNDNDESASDEDVVVVAQKHQREQMQQPEQREPTLQASRGELEDPDLLQAMQSSNDSVGTRHAAVTLPGREEDIDPDEALFRMLQPIRSINPGSASQSLRRSSSAGHDVDVAESHGLPVLVKVLEFLAEMTDPTLNNEVARVFALQLINIVLESGGEALANSAPPRPSNNMQESSPIITVLQGDLCKHLLQNSQSVDLSVLSLTLRVIFNLFNAMKGHLKVQLEVFLTSVHLRIAESPTSSSEQKELALESLLDFCREPALMLDLYTNYDCDFRCTNLFETLCKCLCRSSIPVSILSSNTRMAMVTGVDHMDDMLHASGDGYSSLSSDDFASSLDSILALSNAIEDGGFPEDGAEITVLEVLALDGVLAVIDSIARRCDNSPAAAAATASVEASSMEQGRKSFTHGGGNAAKAGDGADSDPSGSVAAPSEDDLDTLVSAREQRANALRERKQLKRRLLLAAKQFNKKPTKQYWLNYAQDLGVLSTPVTPSDVASFFLETPGLDKAAVGDYLSEDPDRKPFNNEVMQAYIASFDFRGVRIDKALRMLLESFRLPGEAQKVDRLMEAFGKHLFAQNETGSGGGGDDDDDDARGVFKSADAAFIFAFSIIMLHTDLHNPGIAPEKKMKLQEFVRNNRNINEGDNLPESLLTNVYNAIKGEEMRMLYDPHAHSNALSLEASGAAAGPSGTPALAPGSNSMTSVAPTWDTVLRHSQMVDKASFTPKSLGRLSFLRAGVHERDMYMILFDSSMQAISVMFEMTRDGKMAARALEGFRNLGKIAVYFGMTDQFNRIMITLCRYFVRFFPALTEGTPTELDLEGLEALRDATVLSTSRSSRKQMHLASTLAKAEQFAAYPSCRALLTFRALLSLTKVYGNCMRESWRNFVQTLLVMHESDLLPPSFVEVDDVVDEHGNRLPTNAAAWVDTQSEYSSRSRQSSVSSLGGHGLPPGPVAPNPSTTLPVPQPEVQAEKEQHGPRGGAGGGGGFFSTLTSLIWSDEEEVDAVYVACKARVRETLSACRLNTVFSKSKTLSYESLVLLLDALLVPLEEPSLEEDGDAAVTFERNTVLCVELITEVGLSNRERIVDIWPILRRAYRQVLVNAGAVAEGDDDAREEDSILSVASPTKRKTQSLNAAGEASNPGDGERLMKARPTRVRRAGHCSVFVVERVVVSLLRTSVHMLDKPSVLKSLLTALSWLGGFSDELCERLASRIGSGLSTVLRFHAANVHSAEEWRIICQLLDRFSHFRDSVDATWEIVQTIVQSGHVNRVNMNPILDMIGIFIRTDKRAALPPNLPASETVTGAQTHRHVELNSEPNEAVQKEWADARAAQAVQLIHDISSQVYSRDPDFCAETARGDPVEDVVVGDLATGPMHKTASGDIVIEPTTGGLLPDRHKCWMLMIIQLRSWFADPRPEVSSTATRCLQTALWSPPERIEAHRWPDIFSKVLFPLVEEAARDGSNQQVSVRAINLLSRTFLHNVGAVTATQEGHALWLRLVSFMSKALSQDEIVRETTLENLKNLAMVMKGEGIFDKVSERVGGDVLELTWTVIDAQAPDVRQVVEHALEAVEPPPPPQPNDVDPEQARPALDPAQREESQAPQEKAEETSQVPEVLREPHVSRQPPSELQEQAQQEEPVQVSQQALSPPPPIVDDKDLSPIQFV